jgi:hypothetical protein
MTVDPSNVETPRSPADETVPARRHRRKEVERGPESCAFCSSSDLVGEGDARTCRSCGTAYTFDADLRPSLHFTGTRNYRADSAQEGTPP